MNETEITRSIQTLLSGLGVFHYKHWQGAFSKPGIADIIGSLDGRFFAIEVKTPKGRITSAQEKFLQNVRDSGGIAFVARSTEDVISGLDLYDRVLL